MTRTMRLSTLSANGYNLTYRTYRGESHLVIPAVLMVADAVIRPLHSDGPEYVPASELITSKPETMNGRPILYDHPQNGLGSANDPDTLDREQFGTVFNAHIASSGNLVADLYLSPGKASLVGAHAVDVVEGCKSGKVIELSVGTYLRLTKESGTSPKGVPYEYVWRDMSYDHVAVGLSGGKGACSTEIGCGTNRVAASITNEGITMKGFKASCAGGKRCTTCSALIDEVLAVSSAVPRVILEGLKADELRSLKASLEARAALWNPWSMDDSFMRSAANGESHMRTAAQNPPPPQTSNDYDPWNLSTKQG